MEAEVLTPTGKSDPGARKSGVAFYPYYKTFPFLKEKINKELVGEINVKGFAEDSEIKFSKYQDALELSTARANNVIRELIKYKIPSDRLYSTGFGSSKSFQMTEKRVVEFEFRTMKTIQKDELDVESIFNKLKEQ
jgi:hypothetical protein